VRPTKTEKGLPVRVAPFSLPYLSPEITENRVRYLPAHGHHQLLSILSIPATSQSGKWSLKAASNQTESILSAR